MGSEMCIRDRYIGQCAGLSWLRGDAESPKVPVYAGTSADVALSREFLVKHFLQSVPLAVTTRHACCGCDCLPAFSLSVSLLVCFPVSLFVYLLSVSLFVCLSSTPEFTSCGIVGMSFTEMYAFFLLLFLANGVYYRERVC